MFVRVGVPGNQRPVFRSAPYNVTISENVLPDTPVVTVRATDPDGPDSLVEYRISNGADNFYINSRYRIIACMILIYYYIYLISRLILI